MTSYSKNGVSITNTYDAEGVRGSKQLVHIIVKIYLETNRL